MKLTRRSFLKIGGAGALAGMAGLGYSRFLEPETVSLERVSIPIPRLPTALEGFRIAVLSDFHLQPFTTLPHIQKAIGVASALKPDLAVLLGDFVDETVDAIDDLAPALATLNARHGVFSVLGNHDHWKGAAVVQNSLERNGIPVLHNSGHLLTHSGAGLYLGGVESVWAGRPDLARAMQSYKGRQGGLREGGEVPVVMLVHEPDFADEVAKDTRVSLQLSGHSHGGQVRLPLVGALELPSWGRRYDYGLYKVGSMSLYTNRGIGVADIPVRFNCPPEVTEITLHAA